MSKKVYHIDPHFSLAMISHNGQKSLATVEYIRVAAVTARSAFQSAAPTAGGKRFVSQY